jgi:hypothetical protein
MHVYMNKELASFKIAAMLYFGFSRERAKRNVLISGYIRRQNTSVSRGTCCPRATG